MKLTKTQLRKIIREEKKRILERLSDDPNQPVEDDWESQYEEEDPHEGNLRFALQDALDNLPEEKIMEILAEYGFGADEYHWGRN